MVAERFTLSDDAELKKTTNPQLVKGDGEQDFVIAIEDTGLKKCAANLTCGEHSKSAVYGK